MPKTMVLIDDDPHDLDMMKSAIRKTDQSIQCISFLYPDEAVRVITRELITMPDFVIVDMNMPGKNGMECLLELRKKTQLRTTPIIIYSSKVKPEVKEALIEAGATYVFEKPGRQGWSTVIQEILNRNWVYLLMLKPL